MGHVRGQKVGIELYLLHTIGCIFRFTRAYEIALTVLSRLHVLPQSTVKLALNVTFKNSLRQAITGG